MFSQILRQLKSEAKNVSIYTDRAKTSKFTFGSVLNIDKHYFALHMLTTDGQDDGLLIQPIERVYRIEQDGQYAAKMKKLAVHDTGVHYQLEDGANLIQAALLAAKKNGWIVSIELLDSGYNDVVGFVQAVQPELCTICLVDAYGYDDGTATIRRQDITQVVCNSADEQRILRLWKVNDKAQADC